jgi:hypothetical protein
MMRRRTEGGFWKNETIIYLCFVVGGEKEACKSITTLACLR